MGYDDYYHYGQPSYGQPACNPCRPHLQAPGIVAYFDGTDPIRNSVGDAVAFWQSLADPGLGDCVNAYGASGHLAIPNFPQFGCNFGQQGGGHGGGYAYGGNGYGDGGGDSHHAYYSSSSSNSPYAQPFASNASYPVGSEEAIMQEAAAMQRAQQQKYQELRQAMGSQQSCQGNSAGNYYGNNYGSNYGATNSQQETPEQLKYRLEQELQKADIWDAYAEKRAYRANEHASGGHGGGSHEDLSHLSDADVLAKQMKDSEGFKGFLRSRLEKKSGWFSEGDVDTDGLASLAAEYFSQNPEELHGRHISATEVESACFQYIEHNKDNHSNMSTGKAIAGIGLGVGLGALAASPLGWSWGGAAVASGGGILGGLAANFGFDDAFELNKGDMGNIH